MVTTWPTDTSTFEYPYIHMQALLTWNISSPQPPIPSDLLPLLKDYPTDNHHCHVEGIEGDEAHGMVDVDVASPQKVERPIGSKHVKDDVTKKWPLGEGERFGNGHRANDYRGHKDTSS